MDSIKRALTLVDIVQIGQPRKFLNFVRDATFSFDSVQIPVKQQK